MNNTLNIENKAKAKFRRTNAEIELGLTIEEAKKMRLVNSKSMIEDLVDDVTKKIIRSDNDKRARRLLRKNWCFTLNNYRAEDIDLFKYFIETQCKMGGFQSESGQSKNTPHLQGFFVTFERRRFTSFKLSKKTHWEVMRGSVQQNLSYCFKQSSYDPNTGIRFMHNCEMPHNKVKHLLHRKVEVLRDEDLFEWQRKVCNIAVTQPDDRIIYYKYDSGNTGKSQLVKKLIKEFEALIVDGNKNSMTYSILDYYKTRGHYPPIIVLDIPRSQNAQWSNESGSDQSFVGIEMIKNGSFASTKYESTQVLMPIPHVFIFTNVEPNKSLFTRDRWRIERITLSDQEKVILETKKRELREKIDRALD